MLSRRGTGEERTRKYIRFMKKENQTWEGAPICAWVIFLSARCKCSTLCNPMDCNPPGSSVHRIFQARILDWVAVSFSDGSSRPRDWTLVSYIGRQVLYHWATWEAARGLWIYLPQGLDQSGHQRGSQEPKPDALGPPGRRAPSLKSLVPITNQLQLCLSDTVPGLSMTLFRDRFRK